MACERPIRAYAPAHGGRVHIYKRTDPEYWVEPYNGLTLPCGSCILCRQEHARQWAVRITHEASLHEENSFITLTYAPEHEPAYGSLHYPDLQKFWKRLRMRIARKTGEKLRFYAVGEYGSQSYRPHYHACVFGHAFTEGRIILREQPTMLWTCPALDNAWGLGHVSVGALNFTTAQYTASYITKKLRSAQRYVRIDEQTGELIALAQPRSFSSIRPAVAAEWFEKFGQQIYDHDMVVINGQPQKPPKYYDKKLKEKSPQRMEEIKKRRKEKQEPLTKEQAHARAENARARAKSSTKKV